MKRSNPDPSGSDTLPPLKCSSSADLDPTIRLLSAASETISFTRITCLEELDKRALQLQNKKLWESLMERRSSLSSLRERIEQLEHRQAQDDALLCVVNRYWNQLDEDGLILLQRFDSDADEQFSTSTESFLKQLATWDKEEVPEKLQERVHFSKRIIARLLAVYEKMIVHRSRLRRILSLDADVDCANLVLNQTGGGGGGGSTCTESDPLNPNLVQQQQTEIDESNSATTDVVKFPKVNNMHSELKDEIGLLNKENQRLQNLCTDLHSQHRQTSLRVRELQDLAQSNEDTAAEWQAKYEDLDYKFQQAMRQITRLDNRLYDAQEQCKRLKVELTNLKGTNESPVTTNEDSTNSDNNHTVSLAKNKYNDLACELEEFRELAANRTLELERLQRSMEEKVSECASLTMQLKDIPESVILESPQYLSLKVQFNILFNEATQLRSQLEEATTTIQNNRHNHLKQIEEMESNEAAIQQQMRSEMLVMEGQYSQLRHKCETMELDFKQALTHNEQAGPISCEMRSLISTLQTQNKQLKAEVTRYRRKCEEIAQERELIKSDLKCTDDELSLVRNALSEATAALVVANERADGSNPSTPKIEEPEVAGVRSSDVHRHTDAGVCASSTGGNLDIKPKLSKMIYDDTSPVRATHRKSNEGSVSKTDSVCTPTSTTTPTTSSVNCSSNSPSTNEFIRDLKEQLKRSEEAQKEMSVLLNMYKVIPKDQRDKAALLQCEAKLRSELHESKFEIEKLHSIINDLRQQINSTTATTNNNNKHQSSLHHHQQQQHHQPSPITKLSPRDAATHHLLEYSSMESPDTDCPQLSTNEQPCSRTKSHKHEWQLSELQLELQITKRKYQSMEDQLKLHQSRLSAAKQQEDVLLKEMEITVQAFEDVQEQNVRLVKTLREKDDAHLKLMAERLKTAQLARLLKEDKQLLEEQIRLMQAKIEALNRTVRKQEDKERLLLTNLRTLEKEALTRLKVQETYKRKSQENQQVSEDLRVTLQKYQSQLKDAQTTVQEKASGFERVSFRNQRLQEELVTIRRKYERLRRIEQSHNADEFLLAEIQDYKEQLTCSTCKVNRKDAILTKCFHVFCLNCLKIRYETRNRKCPKCNATFGANDYHRIYLT